MTAQHALQKQILGRMCELGIVPVLPAFQGNVPPVMKLELYPGANISLQGGGRHYAAWLDGTDPLFAKIADRYMSIMCADFGCDEPLRSHRDTIQLSLLKVVCPLFNPLDQKSSILISVVNDGATAVAHVLGRF